MRERIKTRPMTKRERDFCVSKKVGESLPIIREFMEGAEDQHLKCCHLERSIVIYYKRRREHTAS